MSRVYLRRRWRRYTWHRLDRVRRYSRSYMMPLWPYSVWGWVGNYKLAYSLRRDIRLTEGQDKFKRVTCTNKQVASGLRRDIRLTEEWSRSSTTPDISQLFKRFFLHFELIYLDDTWPIISSHCCCCCFFLFFLFFPLTSFVVPTHNHSYLHK